jgi:hypothetical protein
MPNLPHEAARNHLIEPENAKIWTRIFKNDSWINHMIAHDMVPVLIGRDLDKIRDDIRGYWNAALLFHCKRPIETITTSELDTVLFENSLAQHLKRDVDEVEFQGFTLNVSMLYCPCSMADMRDASVLYNGEANEATSCILYYTSSRLEEIRAFLLDNLGFLDEPLLNGHCWITRTSKWTVAEITRMRRLANQA